MLHTLLMVLALAPPADESLTYERDVRPLLARRCLVCHNRKKLDKADVSAGLALDTFEAALKGTEDHPVIVPGKAEESALYARLIDEDELRRMPYLEEPLPEEERELIRRWIDSGAPRGEPLPKPETAPEAPKPVHRVVRALDIVLPTEAKVPTGVEGLGDGGPVALVLRAGPLPAVSALAFRGDGQWLAVGTGNQVVLWDLAANRPSAVIGELPGTVHAIAFSRDGRRLAVGGGLPSRSGLVRVYTVPDGSLKHDFSGHEDVVYSVAFAKNDSLLATAGFDTTVRLWDLAAGRERGVFRGHSDFVFDAAFDPDGKTILSAGKDASIKRIDVATLEAQRTYSGHDEAILALAVRPDGQGFVSAGHEPQLRWWERDGNKPTRRVGGHGGPVFELAFSGDGKRLISASGDQSVRLWDGVTGAFQKRLPGPTDWQYTVALSADGKTAAAGGWDGIVRLWDADAGKLTLSLILPPGESPGQPCWLALKPDADWEASDDLAPLVRARVGETEVPIEAIRDWKGAQR